MAILLDQQARATLAHRRARGRDATLMLHLVPLRGWQYMLRVDWLPRFWRPPGLVPQQVGDVVVYVDRRVARYARWRDVTISAWHLGPLERLAVVDEPAVLLELVEWEQTHPGLG